MKSAITAYLSEIEVALWSIPEPRRSEELREIESHLHAFTIDFPDNQLLSAEDKEELAVEAFGPYEDVAEDIRRVWAARERRLDAISLIVGFVITYPLALAIACVSLVPMKYNFWMNNKWNEWFQPAAYVGEYTLAFITAATVGLLLSRRITESIIGGYSASFLTLLVFAYMHKALVGVPLNSESLPIVFMSALMPSICSTDLGKRVSKTKKLSSLFKNPKGHANG